MVESFRKKLVCRPKVIFITLLNSRFNRSTAIPTIMSYLWSAGLLFQSEWFECLSHLVTWAFKGCIHSLLWGQQHTGSDMQERSFSTSGHCIIIITIDLVISDVDTLLMRHIYAWFSPDHILYCCLTHMRAHTQQVCPSVWQWTFYE